MNFENEKLFLLIPIVLQFVFYIHEILFQKPDFYINDVRKKVNRVFDISVYPQNICKILMFFTILYLLYLIKIKKNDTEQIKKQREELKYILFLSLISFLIAFLSYIDAFYLPFYTTLLITTFIYLPRHLLHSGL